MAASERGGGDLNGRGEREGRGKRERWGGAATGRGGEGRAAREGGKQGDARGSRLAKQSLRRGTAGATLAAGAACSGHLHVALLAMAGLGGQALGEQGTSVHGATCCDTAHDRTA